MMYVGIAIDRNGDNKCLTDRKGGAFVWSKCTMIKLAESNASGSIKERQIRLICCMFQLTHSLMMATQEAILDGLVPCHQFVGPVRM